MSSTDHEPAGAVALAVAERDALEDVLDRLWDLPGRAVRLAIPTGSSLLLTATEFRVLKEVAERRGVALTVETEDPLRVQLAGLFGLPAVRLGGPLGPRRLPDPPHPPLDDQARSPGPRLVPVPAPGNGHRSGPLPDLPAPPDDGPDEATGDRNGAGALPARQPAEDEPRFREPGQPFTVRDVDERRVHEVPPRAPAPPQPPVPERPAPGPVVAPATRPDPHRAPDDRPRVAPVAPVTTAAPPAGGRFDELRAAAERRAARRRNALDRRAALLVAAGVALLLALAAVAFVVVLPRATVTLDLKDQTVVAEVPFRVLAPGEEADAGELAVRGEEVAVEVSYTATAETTGVAKIGETAARGTVVLANPTDEPVTIPAGTIGVGDAGAEVRFVEEVTVAAAEDGTAGLAEAAVEMVEPGSAGNLGVGELSGLLDAGVYFSNRLAPLDGGSDREGRGVAQADLDALTARFESELRGLAEARFAERLPAGAEVAASSLSFGEPAIAFDRAAGEPGDTVTLTATVDVRGLAYRPAEVLAVAEPRLREALQRQVPDGYELDPAAVAFSAPEAPPGGDADEPTVVVTASGRAVYRFTDEERAALADRLAGKDAGDAAEILRGLPAVDGFGVDYFPGLLVERMPRQADRIEIAVRE